MASDALQQPPRFFFRVDRMAPTDLFHQRSGSNGEWLPPRPLHSNRLIYGYTTGVWYAYHNWSTTLVDPPDPRTVTEYKTFSFYMNNQSFWIYPEDAVRNKVGDGTGNARISQGDDSEESGSSDEPYDEGNPRVQDWAPLTFHYPIPRDTTGTSYAAARNAPHSTLNLQRPDQRALSQLLPDRYKAPADRRRAPIPWGGMVGDLPILIALIAFSVSPDRVDHYLRHCLRAAYQPHTRPRGEGWTDRRGLVVRVFHEAGNQDAAAQQLTMAQKLAYFEGGGYGKFVP